MKKVIDYCIYQNVEVQEGCDVARVKDNTSLWGLISLPSCKVVLPCKYQSMSKFNDGLSIVSIEGKYGCINKQGVEIVPLQYDAIRDFVHERAVVSLTRELGLIDTEGNIVVDYKYEDISGLDLKCDLVVVQSEGKWGALDMNGKEILPCIYDYISLTDRLRWKDSSGIYLRIELNGKMGLFDINGKQLTPIEFDKVEVAYGYIIAKKEGTCAMFDMDMNMILPFLYSSIVPFPEKQIIYVRHGESVGCIDFTGKKILPGSYSSVWWKDDAVYITEYSYPKDLKGLIDHKGNRLIPSAYENIIHLGGTRYMAVRPKTQMIEVWDVANGNVLESDYAYDDILEDNFIVKSDKKYGVVDKNFKIIIPFEYDKIEKLWSQKMLKVRVEKKWGLIDYSNNLLAPIEYDNFNVAKDRSDIVLACKRKKWGVYSLNDNALTIPIIHTDMRWAYGCLQVEYDGKWGIINYDGTSFMGSGDAPAPKTPKKKTPKPVCKFDDVRKFCDGIAAVQYKDKWGYIDLNGNIIYPMTCDRVEDFRDGFGQIEIGGKTTVIDKTGTLHPNLCFKYRGDKEDPSIDEPKLEVFYQDNKCGYKDPLGNIVIPAIYDSFGSWDERRLPIDNEFFIMRKGDKHGCINRNGDEILPFEFDVISRRYGMVQVRQDDKFALANEEFKLLTPIIYKGMVIFQNGLVYVSIDGEKYGTLNYQGEVVTPAIYERTYIYENGYMVAKKDGNYGLIDPSGKVVCPFVYDTMGSIDLESGLIAVSKMFKYGYIDLTGEVVIPLKYSVAYKFISGFAKVIDMTTNLDGIINPSGEIIAPMKYDGIYLHGECDYICVEGRKLVRCESGKKIGLFDLTNKKELFLPIFTEIHSYSEGWLTVRSRNKWGFADIDGNPLIVDGLEG